MRFNDRLLQGYDIGQQVKKLHGHTRLDLLRDNKVVKRIEKDNTITPWIANAIGAGNFCYGISNSKIMPIKQWFEGCLLTDHENDATLSMLAGNSNITAQAGNDAYSGTNQKRGSFNSTEAGDITGGYRFIWDWATNQGNGAIASVCLTRAILGATENYTYGNGTPATPFNDLLSGAVSASALANIQIIDYENEIGYAVTYSSGTITVVEYALNTKRLHLLGAPYGISSTIATHTISQTVQSYATTTASLSYVNGIIHLITFGNNTGNLYDYAIDPSDWSCTETAHTYSGVSFYYINEAPAIHKDIMPIIGNYIYAYSNYESKIAKCNLTNDADVTVFDNPVFPLRNTSYAWTINGPTIVLANGDWYKYSLWSGMPAYMLYCHNDTFYAIRDGLANNSYRPRAIHNTGKGTILLQDRSQSVMFTEALFPYVSTVNNLDTAVTKSADLTMKLTYEITEV